eukprot:1183265-Prorocentrum_minimum.AAC.2
MGSQVESQLYLHQGRQPRPAFACQAEPPLRRSVEKTERVLWIACSSPTRALTTVAFVSAAQGGAATAR